MWQFRIYWLIVSDSVIDQQWTINLMWPERSSRLLPIDHRASGKKVNSSADKWDTRVCRKNDLHLVDTRMDGHGMNRLRFRRMFTRKWVPYPLCTSIWCDTWLKSRRLLIHGGKRCCEKKRHLLCIFRHVDRDQNNESIERCENQQETALSRISNQRGFLQLHVRRQTSKLFIWLKLSSMFRSAIWFSISLRHDRILTHGEYAVHTYQTACARERRQHQSYASSFTTVDIHHHSFCQLHHSGFPRQQTESCRPQARRYSMLLLLISRTTTETLLQLLSLSFSFSSSDCIIITTMTWCCSF